MELWANLLLSAVENYDPRQLHFVNIISQMSSRQAKLFETVIGTDAERELELGWDRIEWYLQSNRIKEYITTMLKETITIPETAELNLTKTIEKLSDICGQWLNSLGVEFVYGDVGSYRDRTEMREIECNWTNYEDEDEIDYEILASLGLIERVDTGFMLVDKFEFTLKYYHITPLGVSFAKACKIVR